RTEFSRPLTDTDRLTRDRVKHQTLPYDVFQDRVEPVERQAEVAGRVLPSDFAGPVPLGAEQGDLLLGRRVQELVQRRHLIRPSAEGVDGRLVAKGVVEPDRAGAVTDVAAKVPV